MARDTSLCQGRVACVRRWIPILVLLVVVVLLALGMIAYFAYGARPSAPSRASIPGLSQQVIVDWTTDGYVIIESQNDTDRVAALGFAHGVQRAWSVALWRQAALGRLSEWFGPATTEIDEVARRLGIARNALLTYRNLDDDERNLLDSYARGMNSGLERVGRKSNEFVGLGIRPDEWEPWHALAIERLFVWLATPSPRTDTLLAIDEGLSRFHRADSLFRDFLHLGGFEHSAAWTVADSADVALVQRHVVGASALPTYLEIAFVRGDSTVFSGASLPGTPFFPAGRSESRAWALLFHGTAQIVRVAIGAVSVDTLYDRLAFRQGDEQLLRTPVVGNGIVLAHASMALPLPIDTMVHADTLSVMTDTLAQRRTQRVEDRPPQPDTVWVLSWRGLETGSDLTAWSTLMSGETPSFRLLQGSGLILSRSGSTQVIGTPSVRQAVSGGVFISHDPLTVHAATRLDSLLLSGDADEEIEEAFPYLDDCRSTWASQFAPPLVTIIDTAFTHPRFKEEALTYLRNWDFSFDRPSIAASIFDRWMSAHIDSTGRLPRVSELDTSAFYRHGLNVSLIASLNMLAREHGTDMSQWRWEVVAPHRFYFPVWSAQYLKDELNSSLPRTRYAPIELAGQGHPTTLCWGSSRITGGPPTPATWESWVSSGAWDDFFVRRRLLEADGLLTRYRISDQAPLPVALGRADRSSSRTFLLPGP